MLSRELNRNRLRFGMRLIGRLLAILAAAYAGLVLVLYFTQSRLVFHPEIGREVMLTPAPLGMAYEDLRLTTADGVSLQAWFVPAAQPRGTVLFLHGNAGNISHRLDALQMFQQLGYSTLIFDYRGYGNSGGTPSETGLYRDAEAAWNYLRGQRHIPSCRIVVFGESMGGAIAAWLAARQQPAALVIASGFTSVPELAQQLFPYLPAKWLARIRFPTQEYLRAVRAPVLIAHSPEDDVVPYAHGRALFAAANPPKEFLELAGGHNAGFLPLRAAWVGALQHFLAQPGAATCARDGSG